MRSATPAPSPPRRPWWPPRRAGSRPSPTSARGDDIWQCLGGAAGADWADLGDGSHAEWRELKVGLTDPDLALGLPVLASAAAGFFGTTDFAANDPRFGEFEAWLANLAEPSADGDPDPARTLATRPGTYSAAGAVGAVADQLDGRGVETDRAGGRRWPPPSRSSSSRGGDGLPGRRRRPGRARGRRVGARRARTTSPLR